MYRPSNQYEAKNGRVGRWTAGLSRNIEGGLTGKRGGPILLFPPSMGGGGREPIGDDLARGGLRVKKKRKSWVGKFFCCLLGPTSSPLLLQSNGSLKTRLAPFFCPFFPPLSSLFFFSFLNCNFVAVWFCGCYAVTKITWPNVINWNFQHSGNTMGKWQCWSVLCPKIVQTKENFFLSGSSGFRSVIKRPNKSSQCRVIFQQLPLDSFCNNEEEDRFRYFRRMPCNVPR
jgi:hypothetical protein